MPNHGKHGRPARGPIRAEILRSGRPSATYYLLVLFSCALATFGLIADSAAVVIGAMLVAPLLGPILSIGLGTLGGRDSGLVRTTITLISGGGIAVALSAGIALLLQQLPLDALATLPGEAEARTRPNVLDLGIALVGGSVGAFSVARKRISDVLPGVAIATALMPPLCTAGIGLALGEGGVWGGALLLFATNLTAIVFAAAASFMALGLRPYNGSNALRALVVPFASLLAVGSLLGGLTFRAVDEARQADAIRSSAEDALDVLIPGSEIVGFQRSEQADGSLRIRLTARTAGSPAVEDVTRLQDVIAQRLQRRVELVFVGIPTLILDPRTPVPRDVPLLEPKLTATPTPGPATTPTPSPTVPPTATPTSTPVPTATPQPPPTPPLVGNAGLAE